VTAARLPPSIVDRMPHHAELPQGTVLWRVHSARRAATSFRPPRPDNVGGGRFDSTPEDPYPFFYGATEQSTAIAEALLRTVEFDGRGYRIVRLARYIDKRVSAVETTCPIRLITLVSAVNLAAVAQDDWLVQAEPRDFASTRRWAHWVRGVDPAGCGLLWQSKRDRPHCSMVLFGDRLPVEPLVDTAYPVIDFGSEHGTAWLQQILRPYYVTVVAAKPSEKPC
jgi:hypothetical protein